MFFDDVLKRRSRDDRCDTVMLWYGLTFPIQLCLLTSRDVNWYPKINSISHTFLFLYLSVNTERIHPALYTIQSILHINKSLTRTKRVWAAEMVSVAEVQVILKKQIEMRRLHSQIYATTTVHPLMNFRRLLRIFLSRYLQYVSGAIIHIML